MRLSLTSSPLTICLLSAAIWVVMACSHPPQQKNNKMLTSFEKNDQTTATYYETIEFYEKLAENSQIVTCQAFGRTDSGHPLHEVVVSNHSPLTPSQARDAEKTILFINNAIHPGEPCGVDATMMLVRDIVEGKVKLPDELVMVVIPFYNIGGGLNRTSTSRANQLGPEAYGFRGNARNLDLNRDFVKCDSDNAVSFNQVFNKWSPHVMIDNHTSNGADYQYVMTLIATQKDKLAKAPREVMTNSMLPFLYEDMVKRNYEMTPYVFARETPDEGIAGFLDYARYSSGYAALHHTISFMPETHMLKPYADRVWSTYHLMASMIDYLDMHGEDVRQAKKMAIQAYETAERCPLDWQLDPSRVDTIRFKGYEAGYKPSEVSGLSRLYYDRNKPFEKDIPFYDSYKTKIEIEVPEAYIIPQAYTKVIERLEWNGVKCTPLEEDQTREVEAYYIESYDDLPAYEGHYLHYNVKVRKEVQTIQFYAGDYLISTDQDACRYLIETLEPQGPDSYFAWNFFDGVLMQKEYFSPYVFEDLAADLLKKDSTLKADLERRKAEDADFAQDSYAQLRFVYERSPYYERTHKRLPVYRLP